MFIKIILLITLAIKVYSQVTFCSSACSVNSCGSDETSSGCLACDSPFVYNTSNSLPCQQTSGNWELITTAILNNPPNSNIISNCGS